MNTRRLTLLLACWWIVAGLCWAQAHPTAAAPPVRAENDVATRRGFDHFYNLEYDKAITEFETALKAHPDDPFAVNHLLSAVIFKELFRIGALDTESYAGDSFLNRTYLHSPDPAVRDRVHKLVDQSLALSEARLAKNPNDTDALYARGIAKGMRATYMGMAEKSWLPALRSAVSARHDHERVLEIDPQYVDAKVLVGTHLYIVGSLSWPIKVAASVVGLSGSKSKGLDYLRDAANHAHSEVASDARIILALFLRREQKYNEALKVVAIMMEKDSPRNYLVAAEYAHLLNAAGHGQEAIAAYRKVVAGCRAGAYSQCRIGTPAYGLGEALRGQRDFAGAAEAYELAADKGDDPDLRQRATLAAGEMYDAQKNRDHALERYRTVIAENSGSLSAEQARHYMKQAYSP